MDLDKRVVAGFVGLLLLLGGVFWATSSGSSCPCEESDPGCECVEVSDAGVTEISDAGVETVGTLVTPETTEVVPASLETATTSGGETTTESTTTSTESTPTTVVPLTTEVTVTSSTN